MKTTCHLWLEAAVALLAIAGASCLREVSLEMVPDVVQRGEEVVLRCHYDLQNAPLYSLKWYRGKHEFYRFSPSEQPSTKVFNISGINVDPESSNESQVTLRNVDFGLSGTFICEVTADAPTFSTSSASKNLTVVFLPREEPVIVSERDRYDPGDMLRANCSLPPSKPPVHLSFTLNSMPVQTTTRQQRTKDDEGMQWSEISLSLQPFHYTNGRLNLRCTAHIPGIYSRQSELHLVSTMREPVPERDIFKSTSSDSSSSNIEISKEKKKNAKRKKQTLTSENGSGMHTMTSVTILCLGMLHLLLR